MVTRALCVSFASPSRCVGAIIAIRYCELTLRSHGAESIESEYTSMTRRVDVYFRVQPSSSSSLARAKFDLEHRSKKRYREGGYKSGNQITRKLPLGEGKSCAGYRSHLAIPHFLFSRASEPNNRSCTDNFTPSGYSIWIF